MLSKEEDERNDMIKSNKMSVFEAQFAGRKGVDYEENRIDITSTKGEISNIY